MADQQNELIFKSLEEIKVKYCWWYDTIAILPEYDDSTDGILPKGELVKVAEENSSESDILLNPLNHKKLKRTQIPKGRIQEMLLLCKATPLQILVSKEVFSQKFTKVDD